MRHSFPQSRRLLKLLPLRYVISDRHKIVCQGIEQLLSADQGLLCVGSTCESGELFELIRREKPDILVTGLCVKGRMPALEILRQCKACFPKMKLVVLSMYKLPFTVAEVVRAGADAYVLKEDGSEKLLEAIFCVAIGKQGFFPMAFNSNAQPGLKKREIEILSFIADGKTTEEIAGIIGISAKTVEMYRTRLLHYFGMRKSTDLVRVALASGILVPYATGSI